MVIHTGKRTVVRPSPLLVRLLHYSSIPGIPWISTSASQNWLCKQMSWGSFQNPESNPGGLGWGLRYCISNKLPGCADAAGWGWTLSRVCDALEAAWLPTSHISFFLPFPPCKPINVSIPLCFWTNYTCQFTRSFSTNWAHALCQVLCDMCVQIRSHYEWDKATGKQYCCLLYRVGMRTVVGFPFILLHIDQK